MRSGPLNTWVWVGVTVTHLELLADRLCFREEKRCRVREKELREKDILIQDNLIRFSSFLSQQDTRKTKDLEAATIERNVSPVC
jgi:hypothetical protein